MNNPDYYFNKYHLRTGTLSAKDADKVAQAFQELIDENQQLKEQLSNYSWILNPDRMGS